MSPETIRVGIIGAGANTKAKHIPLLRKIPGVEIAAVANRSRASSRKAADEFKIPKVYQDWSEIMDDEELDAVVIGAWPYLHCVATIEALHANKHVLTEARMAMDAHEAHYMLEASRHFPELVTQIVPSPSGLSCDYWMRENLAQGLIGRVNEIVVRSLHAQMADPTAPHTWRTSPEYSGMNLLTLGIHHETVLRWFGDAASVCASGRVFTENRKDPETGRMKKVELPESLLVSAQLASGAHCAYHCSSVAHHGGSDTMEIYGTEGTLRVKLWTGEVELARAKDKAFKPVKIPQHKIRKWTVEEDFIKAIRGEAPIELTTFENGVKYMEFTEAVSRSMLSGRRISLPLG